MNLNTSSISLWQMMSVRRQLTQILLQVTNQEMTELAQDAINRARMKQKGTAVACTTLFLNTISRFTPNLISVRNSCVKLIVLIRVIILIVELERER